MKLSFKILRHYGRLTYILDKSHTIASIFLLLSPLLLVINFRLFFIVIPIIILIVIIALLNNFCIWYLLNYIYLKRQPKFDEYKIKGDYIGIVITTDNLKFWKYWAIFTGGIIILIEYLKMKNISFKLLTNFDDTFDTKRFRELVFDRRCRELYISGHGRKHKLQISKKQNLYYFLYSNAPKKDKIIQLHCNHGGGKSLADFLDAEEDFLTNKSRTSTKNIKYFLDKTKNSD